MGKRESLLPCVVAGGDDPGDLPMLRGAGVNDPGYNCPAPDEPNSPDGEGKEASADAADFAEEEAIPKKSAQICG